MFSSVFPFFLFFFLSAYSIMMTICTNHVINKIVSFFELLSTKFKVSPNGEPKPSHYRVP